VLPALPPGHRLLALDAVDSTNDEAQRLAATGEHGPLWIWALSQEKGRGRHGRGWVSPPGNLYLTHMFPLAAPPAIAAQVGFVAALAVRDFALAALGEKFSDRILLKWPNDVLIDGAKFSGILAETAVSTVSGVLTILLGCGINLADAPEGTPYPVTALSSLGADIAASAALESFAGFFQQWFEIWDSGRGFDRIRAAWLSHAMGLGSPVRGENGLEGSFTGLAENGAMIVTLASGEKRILHSGEVRFATSAMSPG
jgi:BirA family biotin operon repressor/biotin-[acetyl-CoA-carboxylase] ligase